MSNGMFISNALKYPTVNQCSWKITITSGNESIEVGYPLTLNFQITRNTLADSNTASFTILNLSPATRNSKFFFKDIFDIPDVKAIKFEAGYDGNLTLVFSGLIQQCYSWRAGTNIETRIDAMEMGFGAVYVEGTYAPNTAKKDVYKDIVAKSGLKLGALGTLNGVYNQEVSFMGRPIEILNEITGGHTFVDCGVIHTIQDNEAIDYGIDILNAKSGLLGTPKRRNSQLVVESIFNPNLMVGQLLQIESETESRFSGTYKLCGISHSGVISATTGGSRKTEITLLYDNIQNSNVNVTGNPEGQSFSVVKGETVVSVGASMYGNSVAEVYKYLQSHKGDISGIAGKKITERISWGEMLRGNTPQEVKKECTEAVLNNCVVIAQRLTDFCNTNFSGRKIQVNSGWRSTTKNLRTEGSADKSQHIYGKAIDCKILGVDMDTMHSKFKVHWKGGVGVYSWGVHVDTRPSNSRWNG